jgi:uncharacterized protein (DUF1501 family)
MARNSNGKDPVLVVVQLSGGNDFMNTVIPYTEPAYHDARPLVRINEEDVLPLNDTLGWHPSAEPMKELYDEGKVAIVQGVGYPDSNRSHFRGMDIMHTCEPVKVVSEGWVAKAIRDLDPKGENVLTGINVGQVLPRAMSMQGVPVTSVSKLESYGLMTGISEDQQRDQALEIFKKMYGQAIGSGVVMDYLAQTGADVLKGADILKRAPAMYSSDIEYADNPIAQSLRDVARMHLGGFGTRIFYAAHGGYDVHANENPDQPKLLSAMTGAINDFYRDLEAHDAADEVAIMVFTEFGRRIKDNGTGTDHGSGGGSFIIGKNVTGGLYSEYPPITPDKWLNGEDMQHTFDFRGVYATMLDQWLGLDPDPIVGGKYEQVHPFN